MLEVKQIGIEEYRRSALPLASVFDSVDFNLLNSGKTGSLMCLLLIDGGKEKFGVIAGLSDDRLCRIPFSAPYAMLSGSSKARRTSSYHEAVVSFLDFLRRTGKVDAVQITLPPAFYDEFAITSLENALFVNGFHLKSLNLNHHLDLERLRASNYPDVLDVKAKQKLRAAQRYNLSARLVEAEFEKEKCYEIIKQNRAHRGFPLRLSYQDIRKTRDLIEIDSFLVECDGLSVASAIVYHVANGIVQVVYWGNLPESEDMKPMNYLAYALVQHYTQSGKRIIDIGISSEDSVPNFGLCEFKVSIGCEQTIKPTYQIAFQG